MTECASQEIGYLQYINSDKQLPQSPIKGCTPETVVTAERAEIQLGYLQYINSDKQLPQSPIKGCTAETAGKSEDIGYSCSGQKS
jgi:hypothetical protein